MFSGLNRATTPQLIRVIGLEMSTMPPRDLFYGYTGLDTLLVWLYESSCECDPLLCEIWGIWMCLQLTRPYTKDKFCIATISKYPNLENESPSSHISFSTTITTIIVAWWCLALLTSLTSGVNLRDHQDFWAGTVFTSKRRQ